MKIIKKMVEVGFDPATPSSDGRLPFHFLIERGIDRANLTESKSSLSTLTDLCKILIDGVTPTYALSKENKDKRGGDTLLHFAVGAELVDLARYLIDQGAKWKRKNAAGVTPLELAFSLKNERNGGEIVDLMLSRTSVRSCTKVGPSLLRLGKMGLI